MKRILIEGWRGIHQSLALVNQYQLVELSKLDGLAIFHRDLPFTNPSWSDNASRACFPARYEKIIREIPYPEEDDFDTAYRIGIPFRRAACHAKRYLTFIVSEFGLRQFQFAATGAKLSDFCSDDSHVVTPSHWSKIKLLEYGFPEERVLVVPHGVDPQVFFPLSGEERLQVRAELELDPDDFVFLNLGSLTREKGIELLICAFDIVRRKHSNARLLLKDARALYGLTLEAFLTHYMDVFGPLPATTIGSIFKVPSTLEVCEMRQLYGAADAYVSPYRAEGFNLPVIEAIACGIPVIVTKGGATDDYCNPGVGTFIDAQRISNSSVDYFEGDTVPGYHLEPDVGHLVELMMSALAEKQAEKASFLTGRMRVIEQCSWSAVTLRLAELL